MKGQPFTTNLSFNGIGCDLWECNNNGVSYSKASKQSFWDMLGCSFVLFFLVWLHLFG
jgi:hypothetical protein